MSRSRRCLVAIALLAFALVWAGAAAAYHTRFVADNCNYAAPTPTSYITRDGSAAVALRARHEGYQWAGGCWNDNDRDDSPNDPHEDPSTGGEGGDCSGFTFKVWREALEHGRRGLPAMGAAALRPWPVHRRGVQGGIGRAERNRVQVGLIKMDALASDGHIGLVYAVNPDGSDQIIEAKGEAYGTNIWTRTYRGSSSYSGVRRVGWSS